VVDRPISRLPSIYQFGGVMVVHGPQNFPDISPAFPPRSITENRRSKLLIITRSRCPGIEQHGGRKFDSDKNTWQKQSRSASLSYHSESQRRSSCNCLLLESLLIHNCRNDLGLLGVLPNHQSRMDQETPLLLRPALENYHGVGR
jgi:hypothetical protein